jgi:outer membrane protein assembly factor BamB
VYVKSLGLSTIYAHSAATGQLLWSANPSDGDDSFDFIHSSPAVANGVIYVELSDGQLHAFTGSGQKLWSAGSYAESSPAVANGVVYVGGQDYKLHAFRAPDGQELWNWQTGLFVQSSPAVANGMVFVGSNDGYLYAFGLP